MSTPLNTWLFRVGSQNLIERTEVADDALAIYPKSEMRLCNVAAKLRTSVAVENYSWL
jgi:hypothetical protein